MDVNHLAKSHGLKIIWVDNAIGTRRKDIICLNKNLRKHPDYLDEVMHHELQHNKGYTSKDLIMDATQGSMFKTLWFFWKYPKSMMQLIPIDRFKGEWYIDISTIIIYIFIILMVMVFINVR